MKQLIEEQKKEKDVAEILKILAWQQVITSQGAAYTGEKDWALNKILDWHKQSLKKFIDELIAREEKSLKTLEEFATTDDITGLRNCGWNEARRDTLAHLKELKEELN